MFDSGLLQNYLFQYKNLSLEGLGTLRLKTVAAELDFPNKLLQAPSAELVFAPQEQSAAHLYQWLAREFNSSPFDARDQVQQFTSQILNELRLKKQFVWPVLGTFRQEEDGAIVFNASWKPVAIATPVVAERVIRTGASHTIRVGEDLRTNSEMEELITSLNRKPRKLWWVAALTLLLVAIAIIVVFVSDHASYWLRQSNYHPVDVKETPQQYRKS